MKKNTEALEVASKETGLAENADKTRYMVMYRIRNARRSHNLNIDNRFFERAECLKYLGTAVTKQNSIQE